MIVDGRVIATTKPPKLSAIFFRMDVAAGRATGANGIVLRKEPGPLFVQEIFVEQGTYRAEVDNISGKRIVEGLPREDVDLRVIATIDDLEFCCARDLASEPDAPGTHDATVLVELNVGRDVFTRIDDPLFDEPMRSLTVFIAVILQTALASLVATKT